MLIYTTMFNSSTRLIYRLGSQLKRTGHRQLLQKIKMPPLQEFPATGLI
jgi:hypothetical protein